MLAFLGGRTSERKLRLFAVASCRRAPDAFQGKSRRRVRAALAAAEAHADWLIGREELSVSAVDMVRLATFGRADLAAADALLANPSGAHRPAIPRLPRPACHFASAALAACQPDRPERAAALLRSAEAWGCLYLVEVQAQCALLRDLFVNPFLPANLDPRFRTETAVGLAHGIYDDRAFERLPILAGALQEAGCEDAVVLSHCREPGTHVRGCWVLDWLLGNE